MDKNQKLYEQFEQADEQICALEAEVEQSPVDFDAALNTGIGIVKKLLTAYALHDGKPMPETEDLLELFKAFVKGEPSLTAVRDNVRELVYYKNCLEMDRMDALPKAAEKMIARTTRHIYLYLRTRCETEGRFAGG
jgi:hypothetical protein